MILKKRRILVFVSVILLLSSVFLVKEGIGFFKHRERFSNLEQAIIEASNDFGGTVSFSIKELRFPFLQIAQRENEAFVAASVIKLPIMAVAFVAVKEGVVQLEDTFVIRKRDITGGSGVLKAARLPIELTFEELIRYMISKSDNTATNKIIRILGFDYINRKFNELGLANTLLERFMMDFVSRKKGKENYTSCHDVGMILEKIYRKELVSREYSSYMCSVMADQEINDRIPRYLPDDFIVAHKTGLERRAVHDCGVVFSPWRDYSICVLTDPGGDRYATAKEFIADISRLV